MIELASPAGNAQKLFYAWNYGADSAYIGLKQFSLRMKADNLADEDSARVIELKKKFPGKKLYCALNISFHNSDIELLKSRIESIARFEFDAFIVQDMGVIGILKKHFPRAELHLSTQANCLNTEAVKFYKTLGFSRVVLGRETSLAEIRAIKDAAPEMALEAFAHGAMCISYSGRCLLSAMLSGRGANAGNCAHTCRWDFRALGAMAESGGIAVEEKERAGEYFPLFEGEGFTAILSSKDLRMIDHLDDMKTAGVDCIKIEGRMKSVYYTAITTLAYRKALDSLEGTITRTQAAPFIAELDNVPHRASTTAFYYDPREADQTASALTGSEYSMMGIAGKRLGENVWEFESMNKMDAGTPLEAISPNAAAHNARAAFVPIGDYTLVDPQTSEPMTWVSHGHECLLRTAFPLEEGAIIRAKLSLRGGI